MQLNTGALSANYLTDSGDTVGAMGRGLALGKELQSVIDAKQESEQKRRISSQLPELMARIKQDQTDFDAVAQVMKVAPGMVDYINQSSKLDAEEAEKRKASLVNNLAGAYAYIASAEQRGIPKEQAWNDVMQYNHANGFDMGDLADEEYSDVGMGRLKGLVLGAKALATDNKWLSATKTDAQGNVWGVTESGGWQQISGLQEQPKAEAPKTRELKSGGNVLTQEWDEKSRSWKTVATAPAVQKDKAENFKDEQSLRKEFNQLNSAYREVRSAASNVTTALSQNSAAGDLAAATAIMKMLDPGSVVRESELGMAMNATGMIDRVGNYLQMMQNGQRLNTQQRKEFGQLAKSLFSNAENTYSASKMEYVQIAKDAGFNPQNVVGRDFKPTASSVKAAPKAKFLGFE